MKYDEKFDVVNKFWCRIFLNCFHRQKKKSVLYNSNKYFFPLQAEFIFVITSFAFNIMAANTSSSSLYPTINYESTSYIPVLYGHESNYSNSNFTCAPIDMPLSTFLFMLLYAVVCIVGLMGNTLVIYVVLRFSNMQTVTNMYILNLAIADEFYLIGLPFLVTTVNIGNNKFSHRKSNFVPSFQ